MDRKKAKERVEELREEIRHHDYLYYVKNEPEISDEQYDKLFNELLELEEEFPDLRTKNSPTQRVGGPSVDSLPDVEHTAPMLSLESSHKPADAQDFHDRVRKALDGSEVSYVVEPKFDGASVEIVYESGELLRAATRGDGQVGDEITENIRTIGSVPMRLRGEQRAVPELLSVRAEVMIAIPDFQDLNERLINEGQDPFANPRNAAAGTLRQLDPQLTAERPLDTFVYDILTIEGDELETHWQVLNALSEWGFRVSDLPQKADRFEQIVEYHEELQSKRDDLDYEIDGVVIKLNRLDLRDELGRTSHHPRWAFAFKFPPRDEITRVERIIPSVGRTGIVTPIALLRPVSIGGVTISRASLYNVEQLHEKDIREGDKVRVQRAGDVIPEVVERIEEQDEERKAPFEMPDDCPSCGTRLERQGPYLVCPNSYDCPAQLAGRIEHFASRVALDIAGIGEETAQLLVSEGLVENLPDLFEINQKDVRSLEGFGEKSSRKLIEAIDESRNVELRRFLYGLGIPEVGQTMARDLANHFGSIESIRSADMDQFEHVDGIGSKMAEAIHGFLNEPQTKRMLDELLQYLDLIEPELPEERLLDGMKFVFTGGLERWTREEVKDLVERFGADATSSVSSETNYVVVGERPGSKLDEARELDIETLDESKFESLLESRGVSLDG